MEDGGVRVKTNRSNRLNVQRSLEPKRKRGDLNVQKMIGAVLVWLKSEMKEKEGKSGYGNEWGPGSGKAEQQGGNENCLGRFINLEETELSKKG